MTDDLNIHEKLSDLLYKDVLGRITKGEKLGLDALLVEFDLRGLEREKIIARLEANDSFDGDKAYRKSGIGKRAFLKRRLVWGVSVAASVLIVFVVGLWLMTDVPVRDSRVLAGVISPGHRCAMIMMADGKQIEVEKMDQKMEECDGTIIHSEPGKLVYMPLSIPLAPLYNTMTVPRGGEYSLVLADGTRVWLNAETRLRYPVAFGGHQREVFLEGEAFFQVARDEEHPFIVHTSTGNVKVLGTDFNVRDYADEREVVTTLVSGKVMYASEDTSKRAVVLAPGFQVSDRENGPLRMTEVDPLLYTGWREGRYVFEEATLGDIMKTLERWYDFQVIYEDVRLMQLHFTGDLERYEEIGVFLDFIGTGGDVRFKIEGRTIRIGKK